MPSSVCPSPIAPKRHQVHDLRLSAGEHGAAMRPGKQPGFTPNGADILIAAAIRADALVDNLVADDFLHDLIEGILDIRLSLGIFFLKESNGVLFHLGFTGLPLGPVKGIHRPNHLVIEFPADIRIQLFGNMINLYFLFRLADLILDALDESTDAA